MVDIGSTGWILPFSSAGAASADLGLLTAGGKGVNLARLAQAGFPVPGGFVVTTDAYRAFLEENHLAERIRSGLPLDSAERTPNALEDCSAQIRSLFSAGKIPERLVDDLLSAYYGIAEEKNAPVAVRSSATAEDLPEMSFAGQQDTYLNVVGGDALLRAVVDCWSSLWTARAIGYRLRNHVPQESAALAVVVQRMVESVSSGVLFTANPLTGLRSEAVIDAAFGLGEALVSGQVEPDHYVVDVARGQIVEKSLGAKGLSIHGQAQGGTLVEMAPSERKTQQALPDEQILALARLGQAVEARFQAPQDIEWAWASGALYLLQSRAITSLFPIPEGIPAEPLKIFFSFAAVQGMLDPVTPLGRDAMRVIFATGAGLFGIRVNEQTQTVVWTAGERLWINVTSIIRNSVGRRIFHAGLNIIEPGIRQALEMVWDDPRLQPERQGIRLKALLQMLRFLVPVAGNMLLNIRSPRARREMIVANGEAVLEKVRARLEAIHGDPRYCLEQQSRVLEEYMAQNMPRAFRLFVSAIAASMASLNFLNKLASQLPPEDGVRWNDRVLEITRGLPYNPTTEMDLALWNVAQAVRADPVSRVEFQRLSSQELADRYQSGEMPAPTRRLVDTFLNRYGGRGLAEIDMGRTRWSEDPAHVFDVLNGYMKIDDPRQAPDAVFTRGAEAASAALARLSAALGKTRGGWIKARLARFFARRVREMMGIRENPKFFAVRMFALFRTALLKTGQSLVNAGVLEQPDDLFFFTFAELRLLAGGEQRDWRGMVTRRREAYSREMLRRQVPRLLLSDGRAFYEGMRQVAGEAGEGKLNGSPVSPGTAEGRVRVVFDPRKAQLLPGEILVCPGTDPSWTPLFLTASGLVMEVGGMMTHGAVVAREYGIPAIVGVDQATRRLQTGQRIRIDGSTGLIALLPDQSDGG